MEIGRLSAIAAGLLKAKWGSPLPLCRFHIFRACGRFASGCRHVGAIARLIGFRLFAFRRRMEIGRFVRLFLPLI